MPVPDHFHARYSALGRCYRYWILNRRARSALAPGRAWCVHRRLDESAMQRAADSLQGEHDFSAYRAAEFDSLCIGHEAIVQLEDFSLTGGANKPFRNALNRFNKLGYQALVHEPPHESI